MPSPSSPSSIRLTTPLLAALLLTTPSAALAQAPPAAPSSSGVAPATAPAAARPSAIEPPAPPVASPSPVSAETSGTARAAQKPAPSLEEVQRQIDILAAEIERLRSGETGAEPLTAEQVRALGLAPSAAAAYRKTSGVSLAGYGEMLFENPDGATPRIDFLRAIVYTGYRFTDRFVFNSEIEIEHAKEISVEFAYVDFRARDELTVRAGMLLVPLGLVNEFHEPTVFLGARRPETEQRIIPSTWRENGVGLLGSRGKVAYRAYLVNGLKATGFSASGLRGGRQKGAQALAADWAFAGRLDVTPVTGFFAGVSLYSGGSGQDQVSPDDETVRTTILDVHGQAQIRGADVRALYARASLDDVTALNRTLGLGGTKSIGETLEGGYVQLGYNVLSQVVAGTSLMPYYRFERINTQAAVPAGFRADPAQDQTFHTFGVELKPIGHIVVKADYQRVSTRAGVRRHQFNVNLGYVF